MSKTSETRAVLAKRLLDVPRGERIPSTATLAASAGVGFGTVQSALRGLLNEGAITITTHGHQGSRLVDRDIVALWGACDRGAVAAVLPPAQSSEFSGLATALTLAFEGAGVPLHLTFRQGARTRMALLDEGRVDFTVVSASTAAELDQRTAHSELPEFTYYRRGSVLVITASGHEPDPDGRVATDPASYDHGLLTRAEFPNARLVEAPYGRIPDLVARGDADAAVWHATSSSPLAIAAGLSLHELTRPSPADQGSMSRAALAWRADEPGMAALLDHLLDPSTLALVQSDVSEGRLEPRF